MACPSQEGIGLDSALMAGTELSIPQAYFNGLGLPGASLGRGHRGHVPPPFRKPKRKSDKARESQAITDCFFSHVTIFLLNLK